jgi:hypothetical protein
MAPKKIKTSSVEKSDAVNYWKRSQELLMSMRNNLMLENWNAAVIDGVHAVISANDALTAASVGKRSTGSSHYDAVELLKQSCPQGTNPDTQRLRRIISVKNHVEYGPSLVLSADAQRTAQDVERFITWAEGLYRKIRP